jgi:methionyl-tRNA formyltransferase
MGNPIYSAQVADIFFQENIPLNIIVTSEDKKEGRGQRLISPPLKDWSIKHNIPVLQFRSLKHQISIDAIKDVNPDLIIVASYGKMLPKDILEIPKYGCLNIHPSLLPKYRGPSPVASTLVDGIQVTGVSIILMNEEMDAGPILTQVNVPIHEKETSEMLTSRLFKIGAHELIKILDQWESKKLIPVPQNEKDATFTKLLSKTDGKINWNIPGEKIISLIRAYHPWPGTYTTWNELNLKILDAELITSYELSDTEINNFGKVININTGDNPVGIITGTQLLIPKLLQLSGKTVLTAKEFLERNNDFIDATLE